MPELEALVAAYPFRERLRAQLMLALYRAGRHTEALETYRECRKLLSDELGLEPGSQLRELEAAILRHDPALTLTPEIVEAALDAKLCLDRVRAGEREQDRAENSPDAKVRSDRSEWEPGLCRK